MPFWVSLSQLKERSLTPEIMDDPALDESKHEHALRGLERINRFSRSARSVWSKIEPLLKANPQRTYRVLDIATGAGDIPIALSKLAAQYGDRLKIEACDLSSRAVEFAQKRARAANGAVRFFAHDVVSNSVPNGYDILTSSLFFHHLQTNQATELLKSMRSRANEAIVVNDLERSSGGWILANVATRLLSSSPVVHVDGPLSVKAAFSMPEIRQMANQAGLVNYALESRFPCRFLLSWYAKS
jgi:2-polyprenyl-3-methyl-5-hydroxy-6-metoxy-1,4-benzoquinol methylase